MKDTELRGIVLKKYYDLRRSGGYVQACDLKISLPDVTETDLCNIGDQLGEHGLLDWNSVQDEMGKTVDGAGRISAKGVDVIESDGAGSPLKMTLPSVTQNIHINGSQNIQIGNGNTQTIVTSIESLISRIDQSKAPEAEKKEIKGRLREFLEHPLLGAILGGMAGVLVDSLRK